MSARTALATARARLERLAERVSDATRHGCPRCAGPHLVSYAIPDDAPRHCEACGRPINYLVIIHELPEEGGEVVSTRWPELWATSVGRAKGGGRSSKAKGRRAAVEVRDPLVTRLSLAEDDVRFKVTTEPGEDLHLSPAARQLCPLAIEVKNSGSLNIWKALGQSASNAPTGAEPAVFFRRAGTPMFVAVRATWLVEQLGRLSASLAGLRRPRAQRIEEE